MEIRFKIFTNTVSSSGWYGWFHILVAYISVWAINCRICNWRRLAASYFDLIRLIVNIFVNQINSYLKSYRPLNFWYLAIGCNPYFTFNFNHYSGECANNYKSVSWINYCKIVDRLKNHVCSILKCVRVIRSIYSNVILIIFLLCYHSSSRTNGW